MLGFEPESAGVEPEDLVDRVAEGESPVPDGHARFFDRQDLSVQTGKARHRDLLERLGSALGRDQD